MSFQLLDGKKLSAKIRAELKSEVATIVKSGSRKPGLAVILVGSNPASQVYVGSKKRGTVDVGMNSFSFELEADTTQEKLDNLILELNERNDIDGILVQLPLPKHLDENRVIELISPKKDVDGFHPYNLGKLLIGDPNTLLPCTPFGITKFFEDYNIDTKGKHVVVLGRSNIVGKPIANIMLQKSFNSTVTVCHTGTKNVAEITKTADIIVVATGVVNTLTADMVKDDVVIIDVGINRIEDKSRERGYRLVGDVDFEGVKEKSSYITPVPGGVGPMTIAMLLSNTLKAYKLRENL